MSKNEVEREMRLCGGIARKAQFEFQYLGVVAVVEKWQERGERSEVSNLDCRELFPAARGREHRRWALLYGKEVRLHCFGGSGRRTR